MKRLFNLAAAATMIFSPRGKVMHKTGTAYYSRIPLALLLSFSLSTVLAATLDVTLYGAIPNDGQDDREFIQRAIAVAQPGDNIELPPGTYHISKPIVIDKSINLRGHSRTDTTIRPTASFDHIDIGSLIYLHDTENVEVSQLRLDANNHWWVHSGIFVHGGNDYLLMNLHITNFGGLHWKWGPYGIVLLDATSSAIAFSEIHNVAPPLEWSGGIFVEGGSNNQILMNTIGDTGRGAIFFNNSPSPVIRANYTFGSGLSGKPGTALGIEVTNSPKALIEENHVDSWISAVRSDFCAVRNNTIGVNGDRYYWALELVDSRYCIFSENTVTQTAVRGISMSQCNSEGDYTYWAENNVHGALEFGAHIQGETGRKCDFLYFYSNQFLEGAGDGFHFAEHCDSVTVEGNSINDNHNGLVLWNTAGGLDRLSFVRNEIIGNTNYAVWEQAPQTIPNLAWIDNHVQGESNTLLETRSDYTQVPIAKFADPEISGREVTFHNKSKGEDLTYLWDFGEGIGSTQRDPTHTYSEHYERIDVTLVVWDSEGKADRYTKSLSIP